MSSGGAVTRVLLVEGNDHDAQRVEGSLRHRRDWEVVRAGTLLEAIREAGGSRFDAAVLVSELPDGSGLDILDFLRIGSPGIQILLLAEASSGSIAFHALSHGAGDLLFKDVHLDEELPRRLDALLARGLSEEMLVESLTPVDHYDARAASPREEEVPAVERALQGIVQRGVRAAGVWDMQGRTVGSLVQAGLEGDGVGFALATIHGQVGALWTYGALKPTGYRLLIDVEGGSLAVTAIPGTYIVALLLDAGTTPRHATDTLDAAALALLAALQGGDAGRDLPSP